MTEKTFTLGNFLFKLNCNFVPDQNMLVPRAIYSFEFCTQDELNSIAKINMSSQIFMDIVDAFRWNGIEGDFIFDFPPTQLFESYTLFVGYRYMDEKNDYDYDGGIYLAIFKTETSFSSLDVDQDLLLETRIEEASFYQFVQFLMDYAYCSEGVDFQWC